MAVNAVFPTLSTPVQPNASGFQAAQPKVSQESGETTQVQNAVAPADDADGDIDNGLSAGNKQGRGRLVDVKI